MSNLFERSELVLGKEGMGRLAKSTVAVFGIGGVGSFAAEVLARTGIGEIILIDYDIIDITNINRQIHATTKTVGMPKVEVMRDRLLDINPELKVVIYREKYNLDTKNRLISPRYNYVIDAIDMISSKI